MLTKKYIETGVPYTVTCSISYFQKNRRTVYGASISDNVPIDFIIAHSKLNECYYQENTGSFTICPSSVCSCDTDGLATHWIYNAPTDLSTVSFRCSSSDSHGKIHSSEQWTPTVPCKCYVYIPIMFY